MMMDSTCIDVEGEALQVESEEISCHPGFSDGVTLLGKVQAKPSDKGKIARMRHHE